MVVWIDLMQGTCSRMWVLLIELIVSIFGIGNKKYDFSQKYS